MTPCVTVLMAVYNGARYLREAIESILAQTFADFEFVIVNDGSTDESRDIIRSYRDPRIRLLDNDSNIGLTRSLNLGLGEARGALIARQDADDRSHPGRLAAQVACFDANPSLALAGTRIRIVDEDGRPKSATGEFRACTEMGIRWQMLFGNPFVHSTTMFRREIVWQQLGGYDVSFRFNQDFELWSRLASTFPVMNLPEVLLDHRTHGESIVGQRNEAVRESRRLNLIKNMEVQRRTVTALLGDANLAAEWADLWTSLNVSWIVGPPRDPARFLDLMNRLWKAFAVRYPAVLSSGEIRQQRASITMFSAGLLAAFSRRAACGAVLASWRLDPAIALRATPRLAARILLGGHAALAHKQFQEIQRRLRIR